MCYVRGKFIKDFKQLYLRLLLSESFYIKTVFSEKKWESSKVLISNAQNSELLEKIEKLELSTFGKICVKIAWLNKELNISILL